MSYFAEWDFGSLHAVDDLVNGGVNERIVWIVAKQRVQLRFRRVWFFETEK
jgi:hypothetical protein